VSAKDKLLRMLNILVTIQNKPGVQASQLSYDLGVTKRQIYRDIADLSSVVPIYSDNTGYYFNSQFAIYPPDLNDEEILAFLALPRLLGDTFDLLSPEFHLAYEKISASLMKDKKLNSALIEQISSKFLLPKSITQNQNKDCLSALINAMFNMITVKTLYNSRSSQKVQERLIDPYYLIFRDSHLYLIGYCHLRNEIRTFRLSRFLEVELTSESFEMGDFSLKSYLKDSWSIERGSRATTFLVRFSQSISPYVQEEEFYSKPKMWLQQDGSLLFQATVSSSDEFMRWLLQFGPEAEIVEPKKYREQMRKLLKTWSKTYVC
jgi:predicted DNA-binding transcriptional regulator YafY